MPVRNAMPFLDAAIESVLAQTHGDFELIAGDDGSTDGSGERLLYWAGRDRRIRLLRNAGDGLGPAGSANWVTAAARHPFIARMDADDIALPDRLRRQLATFRDHPGTAVVGSLCDYIDASGRPIAGRNRAAFRSPRCVFPCAHGSLMFRREPFERLGGYRSDCDYWEDVDLFIRLGREGRVLILPEILYRYRISPTSSRHVSDEARVARALELCVTCVGAASAGADYDPLIDAHRRSAPRERVSLAVVMLVALERLWRGQPRSLFSSWAWRHASLAGAPRRLRILVFLAWLWLNPTTLRSFLKLKTRFADWRARHVVADGSVLVWRDPAAAPLPGPERPLPPHRPALLADAGPAAPAFAAAGPVYCEAAAQSPADRP